MHLCMCACMYVCVRVYIMCTYHVSIWNEKQTTQHSRKHNIACKSCMCACMYVYISSVRVNIMFAYMYIYTCIYILHFTYHISTYKQTTEHGQKTQLCQTYMHTYAWQYMHTYIHVQHLIDDILAYCPHADMVHIYLHAYIRMIVHTHIHTYIYAQHLVDKVLAYCPHADILHTYIHA